MLSNVIRLNTDLTTLYFFDTLLKIWGTFFKVWDNQLKIWGTLFKVWDTLLKI